MATLTASPVVIPGFTTRERIYGTSPGSVPGDHAPGPLSRHRLFGIDGKPGDESLSYPILAATIIALSALRARANVMVALSGEPGSTVTTDGFIRDEVEILTTLTSYLGTGTTFGIHRLSPTFSTLPAKHRPIHILIITDNDIFSMLDSKADGKLGWHVARDAVVSAKGGATYVLQLPSYLMNQAGAQKTIPPGEARMMKDGWHVSHVDNLQELVVFAKQFSEAKYHKESSEKMIANVGRAPCPRRPDPHGWSPPCADSCCGSSSPGWRNWNRTRRASFRPRRPQEIVRCHLDPCGTTGRISRVCPPHPGGPMKTEGPILESLTHRLSECPEEFLLAPRIKDAGVISVVAIAHDHLRAMGVASPGRPTRTPTTQPTSP